MVPPASKINSGKVAIEINPDFPLALGAWDGEDGEKNQKVDKDYSYSIVTDYFLIIPGGNVG